MTSVQSETGSPSQGDSENKLRALVSLLSDPSPRVQRHAYDAALQQGAELLPFLASAACHDDAVLRVRARRLFDELRIRFVAAELVSVRARLAVDPAALEDGALLLCKARDPHLDLRTVKGTLDELAAGVAERLTRRHSPRSILETLSGYFTMEQGFRGNERNYYDADNSYIDRVLERRTGIPIALCAMILFVGRRLDLPFQGIGLPGHFLLRFGVGQPALFFDPFHSGRVLTEGDCQELLESANLGTRSSYLEPMSELRILLRMIGNLQLVYRNRQEMHSLRVFERLRDVLLVERLSSASGGIAPT